MNKKLIVTVTALVILAVSGGLTYNYWVETPDFEPFTPITPTVEPTAVPTETPTVTPTTAPTPTPTIQPVIRIGELKVIDEFRAEIIITDNIHTFDEVKHKVWCACAFKVSYEFEYIGNDNYKISIDMSNANIPTPQVNIKYVYDDLFVKFDLVS